MKFKHFVRHFFLFSTAKLLQSSLTFIESLEANFHVILVKHVKQESPAA